MVCPASSSRAALRGLVLLFPFLTTGVLGAQELVNPGFEEGRPGEPPPGWFLPQPLRAAGYACVTSDEGAFADKRCAVLAFEGDGVPNAMGNLLQAVDPTLLRGRPIRLRARLRVAGPAGTRAQMWLRADREGGRQGLFDNMGDRPVTPGDWTACEITGVVDDDAIALVVGVMLLGAGEVRIDAVELEATGEAVEAVEPEGPRALAGHGLENLVAFARLFGYVRHFHPADACEGLDWNAFAIDGVRAVEEAESARELADTLRNLVRPFAPAVQVFLESEPPAPVPELARPHGDQVALRWWRHVGFGQPQGAYHSERRRDVLGDEGELPDGAADPADVWQAELGRGVACRVPLALWDDGTGTLPRATGDPAAALPAGFRASGDDRATRLADVLLAWNVLQHFYPYFDVVEVDWPAELERALSAAATDPDERAFLDTLRRMIAALHDGHGRVVHPGDRAVALLPLEWRWLDEGLIVARVGKAAMARGVAPGDRVLEIGGRDVAELRAELEPLISAATPGWLGSRVEEELRRGEPGSSVRLALAAYACDDARYEVELTPEGLVELSPQKPMPVERLAEGLWYVDLDRVSQADLLGALPDLAGASGVVFDLRGYPRNVSPDAFLSHLTDERLTSPQWNFPVVTRPDRDGIRWERGGEWNLFPLPPRIEGKVAFLVGGGSISYAESCMGIVENYGLAEIVGETTAGTNGNVNPFALPGGYTVIFTGMKVLKHDGSRHHGVGIAPTVPAKPTRAGLAAERDEALERAVDAVSG